MKKQRYKETKKLKLILFYTVSFSISLFLCFFVISGMFFSMSGSAGLVGDIVISKIAAFEQSGYEWIEIVNRSNQAVDTNKWKFYEDGSNHGWGEKKDDQGNLIWREDLVLESGELAVVVQDKDKFLENHPDYAGTVIDSAWSSLKESGEEIGLKNANLEIVEVFSYLPCPDGVLERVDINLDDYTSLNWKEISPPLEGGVGGGSSYQKETEEIGEIEETGGNNEGESGQAHPLLTSPSEMGRNNAPTAIIGDDLEVNVGETVFFDGSDSFDEDGDSLEYFWDFGDGSEGEGAQIEHKYEHSGKFSAILRVSDGESAASNAIWVNVIKIDYPQNIHINSFLANPAGPDTDSEFIEICNGGSEIADLSIWILDDIADAGSKQHQIKENLEIDADECIKFYRKETKIALNNNGDSVRLLNPAGDLADEIIYDKSIKDNEIIFQETRNPSSPNGFAEASKKQDTKEVQSSKSKVQINDKFLTTEIEIQETQEQEIAEIKNQEKINSNPQISQSIILQSILPLAIRTVDVYGGTLEGELVKVAGKVTDKSGNVFFVDDGSGAVRIWVNPKSKIDYIIPQIENEIIISGIVSKTAFGFRIIAEKLE